MQRQDPFWKTINTVAETSIRDFCSSFQDRNLEKSYRKHHKILNLFMYILNRLWLKSLVNIFFNTSRTVAAFLRILAPILIFDTAADHFSNADYKISFFKEATDSNFLKIIDLWLLKTWTSSLLLFVSVKLLLQGNAVHFYLLCTFDNIRWWWSHSKINEHLWLKEGKKIRQIYIPAMENSSYV